MVVGMSVKDRQINTFLLGLAPMSFSKVGFFGIELIPNSLCGYYGNLLQREKNSKFFLMFLKEAVKRVP